jgi:hypothetical protein
MACCAHKSDCSDHTWLAFAPNPSDRELYRRHTSLWQWVGPRTTPSSKNAGTVPLQAIDTPSPHLLVVLRENSRIQPALLRSVSGAVAGGRGEELRRGQGREGKRKKGEGERNENDRVINMSETCVSVCRLCCELSARSELQLQHELPQLKHTIATGSVCASVLLSRRGQIQWP